MNYNYYALLICIIKGCSPEQSFEILEKGKLVPKENEIEYIIDLKSTMTYKQIGQIYNVSADTIYRIIKRTKIVN